MNKTGVVYLIGAGPGDRGLITIKGKELLQKANVIVYDYLVNTDLLEYTQDNAEILYVEIGILLNPFENFLRLVLLHVVDFVPSLIQNDKIRVTSSSNIVVRRGRAQLQ